MALHGGQYYLMKQDLAFVIEQVLRAGYEQAGLLSNFAASGFDDRFTAFDATSWECVVSCTSLSNQ